MQRQIVLGLTLGLLVLAATPASAETPCTPEGPQALRVRFLEASISGVVFVVDGPRCRYLRFGSPFGTDQSVISLTDPDAVPTEYVRLATLGLALARRTERVLLVGLGGGTFTNLVRRVRPGAEIDAVELDPVVVEAATRFFGVEPSPRHRIHVADAADFLAKTERRFDLVFLDTYDGEGMPAHLATEAYFTSAVRRLRPGGVVVANFGVGEPMDYVALARRLRAAAGDALCISGREEANLVVLAGAADTLRRRDVATGAAQLDAEGRLPFRLGDLAGRLRDCL
ncbi:MAG: fused MFS/spermidine synthase [Deltaproteobacteria bacterium]|nr:fused MFS/spermidine synthase [Deltaproteobacteria bacterium]MBW2448229.1 fused MFS/spermidine synthase [Deltaproteobacteria bacterium]